MPSHLPSKAIPQQIFNILHANIDPTYNEVGSYETWMETMVITSDLNGLVALSFNGFTDHMVIPPQSVITLNFKNNNLTYPPTGVWIKQINNPTSGRIYFGGFSGTYQ